MLQHNKQSQTYNTIYAFLYLHFIYKQKKSLNNKNMIQIDKNRTFTFIIIIILQLITLFVYGFCAVYTDASSDNISDPDIIIPFYRIFMLIGFALLMMYYKWCNFSSLIFSLICCSFAIQFYPLFTALMYKIFFGVNSNSFNIDFNANISQSIEFGICLMIILCGRIGTVRIGQVTILSTICLITYSLANTMNIYIGSSSNIQIVDAGKSITTFLFAGIFGLYVTALQNTKIRSSAKNETDYSNTVFILIGTIFIWAGFIFFSVNDKVNLLKDLSAMNAIFALTTSVIVTISLEALINKKIKLQKWLYGVLSGGILIGSGQSIILNPSLSIFGGILAGVVTFFYLNFIQNKFHFKKVYDPTGIYGVCIINSILSTIFSSMLLGIYQIYPNSIKLQGGQSTQKSILAYFQLIYNIIIISSAFLAALLTNYILILIPKIESTDLFQDLIQFQIDFIQPTLNVPNAINPTNLTNPTNPTNIIEPIERDQQRPPNLVGWKQ